MFQLPGLALLHCRRSMSFKRPAPKATRTTISRRRRKNNIKPIPLTPPIINRRKYPTPLIRQYFAHLYLARFSSILSTSKAVCPVLRCRLQPNIPAGLLVAVLEAARVVTPPRGDSGRLKNCWLVLIPIDRSPEKTI